jgi:hypothetical protein
MLDDFRLFSFNPASSGVFCCLAESMHGFNLPRLGKLDLTRIAVKAIPVSGKVGNACEMYISPSKKLFDERTTSLDKP